MKDCILLQRRVVRLSPALKSKVLIFWDWDGTLVDTMPDHADLAAVCINKHFGMAISEAREKYLSTTGIPFDVQLEKIFPQSKVLQRKVCVVEYHKEKMTHVYRNPKDFPEVARVIKRLGDSPNIIQVISSSTEEHIINRWVEKTGNQIKVLGWESGSKKDHIVKMKKEHPGAMTIFVSDSHGDMNLPVTMTFGVDVPKEKITLFMESGAAIACRKPVCVDWMEFCFGRIGIKV